MGAQETVFIDDRLLNVDAARGLGWTAIHASHGGYADSSNCTSLSSEALVRFSGPWTAVAEFGVASVDASGIYSQDVGIFAPHALGAVINDDTIPQLRAKIVAGSANNIFAEEHHGYELQRRGIVYAVDYVANSGGTIFDTDRLHKGGFQPDRAWANVRKIYERTEEVFRLADRDGISYYAVADPLSEQRIASLKAVRVLAPATLPT